MIISYSIPFLIAVGAVWMGRRNWSDKDKIQKILELLEFKEGEKVRKFKLLRKDFINNDKELGVEYVYKHPLKISIDDVERIYPKIRDGINIKREGNQKHVEISYDGALKIRIYERDWREISKFPIDLLKKCKSWNVPIGVTRDDKILWHDFEKNYHALIGGTSGYGKTELIRLICHILMITKPNQVKLTIIDLKGGLEFMNLNQYKQVKKVCSDEFEAEESLKKEVEHMKEIRKLLLSKGVRDVKKAKIKERHFIIVDEAAELSTQGMKHSKQNPNPAKLARDKCDFYLSQLARLGRSTGHRVIYCTQYPLRETINPQIKNNLDARIAMKLKSGKASEVVLDEVGAEKLPYGTPGRALYKEDELTEIQTYYFDESIALELLEPYKVVKTDEHNTKESSETRGNFVEFGEIRIPVNEPTPESPLTWKLP